MHQQESDCESPRPPRKSLRTHQQLNYHPCGSCLLYMSLPVLAFLLIVGMQDKPDQHVPYHEVIETDLGRPIVGKEQSTNKEHLYLNQYCTGKQCKESQRQVLSSLIEMMQSLQQPSQTRQAQPGMLSQVDWEQILSHRVTEALKLVELRVIKHPKLTTPVPASSWSEKARSLVGLYDPYAKAQAVLHDSGGDWTNDQDLSMLTIGSHQEMSPRVFEIIVDGVGQVSVVGLLLDLQNELVAVKLGRYTISSGLNRLPCLSDECLDSYPMLLLILPLLTISSIRVHIASEMI